MRLTAKRRAAFPYGDLDGFTRIGPRNWYQLTTCTCADAPEGPHGALEAHLTADGEWCAGGLTFAGHDPGKRHTDEGWAPGPTWQLVAVEPLHIEPSVKCTDCGMHGWIRGDRWEPAGDST